MCFFNAKCSLLFVRVYGRFGRERRSPGQRFFQMLNARFVPTHPVCARATWHLQGRPEQVSEQDSRVGIALDRLPLRATPASPGRAGERTSTVATPGGVSGDRRVVDHVDAVKRVLAFSYHVDTTRRHYARARVSDPCAISRDVSRSRGSGTAGYAVTPKLLSARNL